MTQDAVSLVLYCHWYVSPLPVAATVNVAVAPAGTVTSSGWAVIANTTGVPIISVAGSDSSVFPFASVTMHRYWRLLNLASVTKLSSAVLLPLRTVLTQDALSLVLYCHWYVKPFPVAATVNVAVAPAGTVTSSGWAVIDTEASVSTSSSSSSSSSGSSSESAGSSSGSAGSSSVGSSSTVISSA